MSYFFFLYQSPSSSLCLVSDFISSNIEEVFLVNPSANVFVFGDLNVHYKYWLTYSGRADRPGEWADRPGDVITQMFDFSTPISDCDSHSPAFLNSFLSCNSSICSAMTFPPLRNFDHVVVSVSICFPPLKTGCPFHSIACDYSFGYWGDYSFGYWWSLWSFGRHSLRGYL